MANSKIEISKELLRSRIDTVAKNWLRTDATDSFDAVLLVTGLVADDEVQADKTIAMHHWLFGFEFPETVVILQRGGKVIVWTSSKKVKYFQDFEGPDFRLVQRVTPASVAADASQFKEVMDLLRTGGGSNVVLGIPQKETPKGPFAQVVADVLPTLSGFTVEDCREGISRLLAKKDEQEVKVTKESCSFACEVMKKFSETMETIIDEERQVTHAKVCSEIEDILDNDADMNKICSKTGLQPSQLDISSTLLQTGKTFNLKPGAMPTDDQVAMTGAYVLSVSTRCREYAATVTRTMMVNPSTDQKEAYLLTLEVIQLVINRLKPGAMFKDVYREAKGKVQSARPDLVPRLVKSLGYLTGLELRDSLARLDEKSEREVEAGNIFVIAAGFESATMVAGQQPWAVWVAQTVLVPASGEAQVLTSACSSKLQHVMWELDDGDRDAGSGAVAAQGKPTLPVAATQPAAAAAPAVLPVAATQPAGAKRGPNSKKQPVPKAPPKAKAAKKQEAQPQRQSTRLSATTSSSQAPAPAVQGRARSTRGVTQQVKESMAEQVRLEEMQMQLRAQKLAAMRQRFEQQGSLSSCPPGRGAMAPKKLGDCKAYADPSKIPKPANCVQIDVAAEALLVPIKGALVPFHCRTIKNMARFTTDNFEYLRVNFFVPGQGKSSEDFPEGGADRLYVKELVFKSKNGDNFHSVRQSFVEVQKRLKFKDTQGEVNNAGGTKEVLKVIAGPPVIRDMNMRPTMGSGSRRSVGQLEAHANCLRFMVRGQTEKVELFYSQVKHAFFQPCGKGTLIVLMHFHLKEAVMIGKKKTFDVQFFTEVAALTEDLSTRRAGNAHDPDEILEEQREQELKERLNTVFHEFCKKVQAIPTCPLTFSIPEQDLSFPGVAHKGSVTMYPCNKALVALQEWPPFCLSLEDIDIVVFERAMLTTREFDMAFINKDYSQPPVRVTMVPTSSIDFIKSWLANMKMIWYSVTMNMNWQMVLKEIISDPQNFFENNGWEGWFGDVGGASSEEAAEGSDFVDEDSDADEDDDDGDDDFDGDDAEEESDAYEDDDEESGLDWDELEREAERSDRKRDRERGAEKASTKRQPPAKKTRR
eukprot:TRINITY_DN72045_c0_g1_i1.p1 TRINITY_DN72045_c0_g1~~TRINITY_DN72045_c0_g1_i1.p1  ORF type:complete len:1097 (-),score=248.13 TRINITY_DN72045_c0_g1_i1:361-3651(-)